MKIRIFPYRKLNEIQKDFAKVYPYLKLEFFTEKHTKGEGSLFKHKLSPTATIKEATGTLSEGTVDIGSSKTVLELERELQETFQLPTQVFRKSTTVWLETTETDGLTLERQNEMGREVSNLQTNTERYLLD
jgi:hypothetical protein